jgi:hypothetical protein
MIRVHTVRVIKLCFFFSYSDVEGFFSSTFPFRTSFRGLPGSEEASVPELCRLASAPLPRCWNLTAFGFAMSIWVVFATKFSGGWVECAVQAALGGTSSR